MSDRNSKVSGRNSTVSNRPKFKDFRNSQTKIGFRKAPGGQTSFSRSGAGQGRRERVAEPWETVTEGVQKGGGMKNLGEENEQTVHIPPLLA